MKKHALLSALAVLSLHSLAARADTATAVTFPGPINETLSGVVYKPADFEKGSDFPAVVMLHGCSGMWSNGVPFAKNPDSTPDLQSDVEKWGLRLASKGFVALAVDSFTARTPAGVADSAWQDQCTGSTYAGAVDPSTTRVQDARAAWAYLVSDIRINPEKIGLMGWSQGAQAAMVEAAETFRGSNTSRLGVDRLLFATTVAFYPDCGPSLDFGGVFNSFWRPYADIMVNIGTADGSHGSCVTRAEKAIWDYGATIASGHHVVFKSYSGAGHDFDGGSESWPTAECSGTSATGDDCAMRSADIRSLDFLLQRL